MHGKTTIKESVVWKCSHRAVRVRYHTVEMFEVLIAVFTPQIVAKSPYKIIIYIYVCVCVCVHIESTTLWGVISQSTGMFTTLVISCVRNTEPNITKFTWQLITWSQAIHKHTQIYGYTCISNDSCPVHCQRIAWNAFLHKQQ